jgi:DnaJ-class molecular chaperone
MGGCIKMCNITIPIIQVDEEKDRAIEEYFSQHKKTCKACNGKGYIEYYHDAGDHFCAGTSPFSEWVRETCKICKSIGKIERY